jgi:hypothetical protein
LVTHNTLFNHIPQILKINDFALSFASNGSQEAVFKWIEDWKETSFPDPLVSPPVASPPVASIQSTKQTITLTIEPTKQPDIEQPTNKLPIQSTNELPVLPANEPPVLPANKQPIQSANELLPQPTNELPVLLANKQPVQSASKLPVLPVNELPVLPANEQGCC